METPQTQPEKKQRFHHRHLPSFTRFFKALGWKWVHLYFPQILYVFGNKYERRTHHLIIDMVYAFFTFMLIGVNLGLALWYFLYFTPADIALNIATPATVTSGQRMNTQLVYSNFSRDVEDVTIDVHMPKGFVTDADSSLHVELGDVDKHEVRSYGLTGTVFGHVGATYDVVAVVSYTSLGRRQTEPFFQRFMVSDSSFAVSVTGPKAVTYGEETVFEMKYHNQSDFPRTNVEFHLTVPTDFDVRSAEQGDQTVLYDSEKKIVTIPRIGAQEEGTIQVRGVFQNTTGGQVVAGDKQVSIGVEVTMQTETLNGVVIDEAFYEGGTETGTQVVLPRLALSMFGKQTVQFSETITAQATVKNTGDSVLENVELFASMSGVSISSSRAVATLQGETDAQTVGASNGQMTLPVISTLGVGEEAQFTISIPTFLVQEDQIQSSLTLTGRGYSPDLETTVPMNSSTLITKFHSHIVLDAEVLYEGPNGEQIGYGPYPPKAWDVTAVRIVLRIQNTNNPLSNVRVRAVLPGQVDWTGLSSVSAGTQLSWNEASRTVEWVIPSLKPKTDLYGAQFEVRFLPNHLQIGLKPNLLHQASITALDAFTQGTLTQGVPALTIPVAIVE